MRSIKVDFHFYLNPFFNLSAEVKNEFSFDLRNSEMKGKIVTAARPVNMKLKVVAADCHLELFFFFAFGVIHHFFDLDYPPEVKIKYQPRSNVPATGCTTGWKAPFARSCSSAHTSGTRDFVTIEFCAHST